MNDPPEYDPPLHKATQSFDLSDFLSLSLSGPKSGRRVERDTSGARVATAAPLSREPVPRLLHKGFRAKQGARHRRQASDSDFSSLISRAMLRRAAHTVPIMSIVCRCKQTGVAATAVPHHGDGSSHGWTAKRAYRRARQSASAAGGTWYKGKWHTAQTPGAIASTPTTPATRTTTTRSPQSLANRLRICSHNVGMLSTDAHDELMSWLQMKQHQYDVICIQETGWSLEHLYLSGPWYVISSGHSADRNSGVMVLVARRLLPSDRIRYAAIIPGRILHVKLEFSNHHVDVINVYQHPWNTAVTASKVLHQRDQIWTKLNHTIGQMAVRNTLLICGDFNTPLSSSSGRVGSGILQKISPPPDMSTFDAILETYNLVALNTWGDPEKSRTFYSDLAESQIDFVLTRRRAADPRSRKLWPDPNIRLFEWRGGGRHLCLHGSIPCKVYQPAPPTKHAYARQDLLHAAQHNSPAFQSLEHAITESLSTMQSPSPEALNDMLLERCQEFFPVEQDDRRKPWQMAESKATVAQMWRERRMARKQATWYQMTDHLQYLFKAWRHQCRFQQLHSSFRKDGRRRRRDLYLEQIKLAEEAARKGDQKGLYAVVRRLAPKQERRRVQLRGDDNNVLTNEKELAALSTFCQELFLSAASNVPIPYEDPMIRLEENELRGTLQLLKPAKAAPRHLAPAVVWKHLSHLLAGPLLQAYQRNLDNGLIPTIWTGAWIVWLPKPSKPPCSPGNLRPIALQDCGGKFIAKALQIRAAPWVQSAIQHQPQYAYSPGRLLEAAILRAIHHCRDIKQLLLDNDGGLRARRQGKKKGDCVGGATLALDMSQAFDRVDRTKLCEALCRTGMPAELINTIVHWHNTIQYHVQVADLKETIHCGRGLRQGCTLSPTLWVAITSHVLYMLGQTVTEEWIRDQLTLFADDVLGQWSFNSEQDLTFMLHCMDAIFSVLEAFGMKVNDQKSSLIIQVKGRVATDWLKARARTVKGVKTFVTATPQGRILYIPIVQQIKYLGIMLSYHNPAKHTVAYRLRQAEAQRRRLQKVLQGKHILSIKQRVQLWKAYVWTSLQHGLNAVGVGWEELRQIRSCCARQLRALSSSPVHITHESTEALFRRLGFEEPHLLLGKRMNTLSTTLANSRDPMMHTTKLINTVQQNQWQLEKAVRHWQNIKARQKSEDSPDNGSLLLPRKGGMWLQPVVTSRGVLPAQFMCPQCLLFFVDMRMLKKHHVDSHGTPLEPLLRNFDRFLHSRDDMPTCRHCEHEFQTWQALQGHILGNHCSAFWLKCQDPQQETEDTSSPGQPTLEQGKMNERNFSTSTGPVMCHDDLRNFLGTHGWPAIVQLRSMCMHLRSHCAICDQWTHPWKLKLHYRGSHSTIWQDYGIMVDSDGIQ